MERKEQGNLTYQEFFTNIAHGSSLAALVFPLIQSGRRGYVSEEYACEFVHAFEKTFILGKNASIDFLLKLSPAQREIICEAFIKGGVSDATYQAGEVVFSVSNQMAELRKIVDSRMPLDIQ